MSKIDVGTILRLRSPGRDDEDWFYLVTEIRPDPGRSLGGPHIFGIRLFPERLHATVELGSLLLMNQFVDNVEVNLAGDSEWRIVG